MLCDVIVFLFLSQPRSSNPTLQYGCLLVRKLQVYINVLGLEIGYKQLLYLSRFRRPIFSVCHIQ